MKRFVISLAAAAAMAWGPAQAASVVGFTGDFGPANWTTSTGAGGADPVADANFLSITSPAPADGVDDATSFSIVMGGGKAARISFSWVYSTSDVDDSPFFDPFGVITDDGNFFTQLTDDFGDVQQQGSFSVIVGPGETFGFKAFALDGDFGTATTRVGDFRVDLLPEPTTLLLMAAALAAVTATRRRQGVRR